MSRLSRFLASPWHWVVVGVLILIGHTIFAIQAIQGDRFALYCLIGLLFVYTLLAIYNGIGRRSSLRHWENSLEAWDETQKLAVNYVDLLMEACHALATWDREQANEIIARTRTISALRQANFDERMGND